MALRRRSIGVLALWVAAGCVVGVLSDGRAGATVSADVPDGRIELRGIALSDPIPGTRPVALIRPTSVAHGSDWRGWDGPVLVLVAPPTGLAVGERVVVDGVIDPGVAHHRGRAVGGIVTGTSTRLGPAPNPILRIGNVMRRVVLGHLDSVADTPQGALLAGFLIGDTSRLSERDSTALRQAGLAHFVAVSGSNVALFLAAWWVVGGPLGLGPRRRAAFGMVGILLFTVITRWEPSVVRASVMAALVLAGRWAGRPITPWTALGGAVALSLLVAPELAGSVGFTLSVAATGGILLGVPLWIGRRPAALWAVLGATVSAQAAVAPLLLLWFGSIPLMAPLANLLAAPVVSASTAVGGVGAVFGVGWLVDAGAALAGVVLAIARTSAELPQLGPLLSVGLAIGLLAVTRARWARPLVPLGVAVAVIASIAPVAPPDVAMVHFLDVGQGDAAVFRGPTGEVVLVDGGPDPELLRRHLRGLGVERVDLLVVTHLHADHTTGLVGITEQVSVGMVWHAPQMGEGGSFDSVLAEARDAGARVEVPRPGDEIVVGSFRVEAVAPLRRYAGPNDGSVAVLVTGPRGGTVLMSGDIEVPAQQELGPIRSDIMKVPHQGAATSDLGWLGASAPKVAVISVGPNDYGHPSDDVIAALEAAGAIVLRTDRDGTVSLPVDDALGVAAALASGG